MLLTSIYKSVLTRFLAAAIIVLVVSPYSEPFATITGTDFGGAGAVDVGDGGSKFKSSTQDAITPEALTFVIVDTFVPSESPLPRPIVAAHSHQRLILRL